MAWNDLINAHRSNLPDPISFETFGRVGNSADGEGYRKTQKVPETTRIDDTGTYIYVGYAIPGSATSGAVWRVKRIENATGNSLWADGDALYNNVWDDHASLSYS